MFDQVLGRGVPKRRLGVGLAFASLVYVAGAVALVEWRIDLRPLMRSEESERDWPVVIPTGGFTNPPRAGAGKTRGERQRPNRSKPPAVSLEAKVAMLAHQDAPQPSEAPAGDGLLREDDVPGRGDGEVQGGEIGPCQPGGDCGPTAQYGLRCSDNAPCSAGANLSPPILLEGSDPQYTKEALAAGVEGLMEVSCVLTQDGTVRDCEVEKSLPHMEKAVVKALTSRRYVPAKLLGAPVAVQYQFHVRLVLPEAEAPKKITLPTAPIPL